MYAQYRCGPEIGEFTHVLVGELEPGRWDELDIDVGRHDPLERLAIRCVLLLHAVFVLVGTDLVEEFLTVCRGVRPGLLEEDDLDVAARCRTLSPEPERVALAVHRRLGVVEGQRIVADLHDLELLRQVGDARRV